jgi:hypothetical protein
MKKRRQDEIAADLQNQRDGTGGALDPRGASEKEVMLESASRGIGQRIRGRARSGATNSIAAAERIGLFNGRQNTQKSPSAFFSGTGWPSASKRISSIPLGVHTARVFSLAPCRDAAFAVPKDRSGRTAAERILKKSAARMSHE